MNTVRLLREDHPAIVAADIAALLDGIAEGLNPALEPRVRTIRVSFAALDV